MKEKGEKTTTITTPQHPELAVLTSRLKEADLDPRRFLKVRNKKAYEVEWQNRLHTPDEVKNDRSYGIAGREGLVLIDVDQQQVVVEFIRQRLPLTFETISPRRGLPHFYYKIEGGDVENKILHLPGVEKGCGEIRAQNHYVIAPGSVIDFKDLKTGEEKTGRYEIIHDRPIAEVNFSDFMEAMKPLLGPETTGQRVTHQKMREGVSEGTRHAMGMKYASFLVKVLKFDVATALGELRRWNKLCRPPMGDKDLERMVRNALAYPDREKIEKTKLNGNDNGNLRAASYFRSIDKNGVPRDFVPTWLADDILKDQLYAALTPKSKIWKYNPENGIWEPDGVKHIRKECKKRLGDYYEPIYVTKTIDCIRDGNYILPDKLGSNLDRLVVVNGVINLDTGELTPFNPELYEIIRIPVTYDPEAKAPKIVKFLNEVLTPEDILKIFEVIGYCLLKSYPIARIIIFHGSGGNGKSQLITIIKNFLGAKNVKALTLQQIAENTFAPAHLHGKLANLAADIPETPIKYTGIIKTLTGGDLLTAHYKYFSMFNFMNHAKLIFSANTIPPARDNTPAWLRRPVIIEFPNIFPAGDPNTIPDLGEKLSSYPEELSGLLNLALAGLKRLLKHGKFTGEEALAQRAEKYIRQSNPAQYFITEFVEEAPNLLETTEKGVLYKNYVRLCHVLKRRPLASNKFSAEIPRYLPYIDDGEIDKIIGKTKTGKTRTRKTRVWYGIRLKNEKLTQATAKKREGTQKSAITDTTDTIDPIPAKICENKLHNKEGMETTVSTVSMNTKSAKKITLLDRIEEYMRVQKSVNTNRAARALAIPHKIFLEVASTSKHLRFDFDRTVVNWVRFDVDDYF